MATQDHRETVDEDSLIDQVIDDRYKVTGRIGAGGVGVVYRAEHVKLARPMAVKVLQREYAAREPLRLRFEREARAMAALSHPNIVAISDYGVWRDLPFLVMELLAGQTLKDRLAAGQVPVALVLAVARQVLGAVGYAHEQGLLHRDLKPGNVFLGERPGGVHVTILDFGLAKFVAGDDPGAAGTPRLTVTGMAFGTPAYMAPEQAAGAPTDRRTDLYSVGVVLYEMVAGRLPFIGDSGEMMRQHLFQPPPKLSELLAPLGRRASPELEAFFAKVLAKERSGRFQTAGEMLDAFEGLSGAVGAALGVDERDEATASTVFVGAAATKAADPTTAAAADPTLPDHEGGEAPAAAAPAPAPEAPARPVAGAAAAATRRVLGFVLGAAALVAVCLGLGAAIALCSVGAPDDGSPQAAGPAPSRVEGVVAPAGPGANAATPPATPLPPPPVQQLQPLPGDVGAGGLWGGAVDPVLADARARLDAGQELDDATSRAVMAFAYRHRDDPRPWILLGRWRFGRRNLTDAIRMYEEAYKADPAARTDPHMLHDLVELSGSTNPSLGNRASRAVQNFYGASALAEVDRALSDPSVDEGGRGRLAALRAELARMQPR